ncbi:hypothetical protein TVAG_327890 [Trichomonas vaginalis G3]|uniref:Uncharacterized protein n=1 Tax=Trichomonas vaginalis (strain ATCC PRA-98 / G3) TaxID=412133 RepID=A2FKW2_TRIV3|nr:armadillo (ARM) repeat-containing protein family [Trichomonas vaginalis G3]EAX94446.1 hypothetical protein TVAG_327890 [Trichomonas vaginalis G3]KAI5528620.1 armadillo (ARM) repeat-containing protein family [Trichomonas vaginalis G3]|eukprot:XP_001307376.1 hypothetical protein [Trichomonas vaginalis G3]
MNFLLYEGKDSLEDVFNAAKILTGAIHLVNDEMKILPQSFDVFFDLCEPGLISEFLAELVYTHPDTPALEPIMQFIFDDDHVNDETLMYSIRIMKGIVFKDPSRIEYFMHNKKVGTANSFLKDLLDNMGDSDEFSSEFMEIFSECLIKQCNHVDELIGLLFEYKFIEFAFELLSQDYVLDDRKCIVAQFLVSCFQNSSLHDEVIKHIRQGIYINLCQYLSSCPSILKEPLLMIISHVIKNDGYLAIRYSVENNILENLEDLIKVCPSVTITCLESIFQYSAEGFFRDEIKLCYYD